MSAAKRLDEKREDILQSWEEAVRVSFPAVRTESHPVLRNSMPEFVSELAEVLAGRAPTDAVLAAATPREHAAQRAGIPAYSLRQVLQEYRLLRNCILDVLYRSGVIEWGELRALLDAIDLAILEAASHFVELQERERTHLAAQLRERNAELEAVNRRKDEFLAMLGHELRNPLSPIRAAVEVMRLRSEKDDQLHWVQEVIERQVQHMSRLVDDLLDVARITRGRVQLRKERVQLAPLVEQAVESVRPFIDERYHRLSVALPAAPTWLEGDPTRIAQIVANLLHNASKYTPPRGTIELEAIREGDEAVIRVRDSGVGIEPALLPHVFDLFVQGSRELDRRQGGLGIGLTLVRTLVELHGGSVEASSDGPGRGSELLVRLPVLPEAEDEQAAAAAATGPASVPSALRVLVVDDNADAATTLVHVLSLWGQAARAAGDGPAAIQIAREWRPQLVLLDIGLPGMDGYAVAERLRAEPGVDGMRIVALTGYGQAGDVRRSREAGFDEHFTKPVDLAALRELLDTRA
jgi:signal transduction histidine kinase